MKFKTLLRCSCGVSYIQVLLASSVIAGLAVVGLKMMEDQKKLARFTSQKFEIDYLVNEIRHILKDPMNCRVSFIGLNPKQSSRRINSLKKELRGGRHKDSTYYLKYSTFDSSKKYYGQNNIKIEKYELSDESQDVDVEKGSTNLVITFTAVTDNQGNARQIKKFIPLRFKLNTGGIASCELFNNQSAGSSQHNVLGRRLVVGEAESNAPIALGGGMTFVPRAESSSLCDRKARGTVAYFKKYDGLFVCNEFGIWSTLGKLPFSEPVQSYRIKAGNTPSISQTTERHRVCVVKEFNSNVRGSCTVEPLEPSYFKNYKLTANFKSSQGGQYCLVECFN